MRPLELIIPEKGDRATTYLQGNPWYPAGTKFTIKADSNFIWDRCSFTRGDHKTPLPYFRHIRRDSYTKGVVTNYQYMYKVEGVQGFMLPLLAPDSSGVIAEAEDRALAKMIKLLRNREVAGHDFLVSTFESPELRTLFTQLNELMRDLRKMRFNKILRKASPAILAAEYYLMWTFAIAPLITCCEEIMNTLNKGMINAQTTLKATATAQASYQDQDGLNELLCSINVRSSLQTTVELQDIEKLLMHQFGLSTPGSAYYATLPLSFVFDWFINVGGYLNTLEYLAQSSGYKMGPIIKSQKVNIRQRTQRVGLDLTTQTEYNCYSFMNYMNFDRTILSALPKPHLPTWKPSLNGGKLVSMFALAISLLFGGK